MNPYPSLPTILIVTEGFTEKNYLERLRERDAGYSVIVKRSPEQRPDKILKYCEAQVQERDLELGVQDAAYCVFDTDYTPESKLQEILDRARKKGIKVILSKPCFEVFFLLHFTNNVDMLAVPKDAKEELGNYLEGYSETEDYWKKLLPMQQEAIARSRRFTLPEKISMKKCVNGTNIYELFDELERRKNLHRN